MTYSKTTGYLVALRAWYNQQRRAAMAGEPFDATMPSLTR